MGRCDAHFRNRPQLPENRSERTGSVAPIQRLSRAYASGHGTERTGETRQKGISTFWWVSPQGFHRLRYRLLAGHHPSVRLLLASQCEKQVGSTPLNQTHSIEETSPGEG